MINRKQNPEEAVDLYETIADIYTAKKPSKSDKEKARRAAVKLRKLLSDNDFSYWTIRKKYVNMRKPDIDKLVTIATKIAPNPSYKSKSVKSKNPVRTLNRTGEVILKYKGNKIVFDGKDADSVLKLVKKEYSDNSELQNVLG